MMCKWFVYGLVGPLCPLGALGIAKFGAYPQFNEASLELIHFKQC